MELKDLRYFCLAAELGSITRAAETLGVSQPFVTKVSTGWKKNSARSFSI